MMAVNCCVWLGWSVTAVGVRLIETGGINKIVAAPAVEPSVWFAADTEIDCFTEILAGAV
jgi:hypothetical protein